MRYAGIDIGSRSIELVVVDDEGLVLDRRQADTGFDPLSEASRLIGEADSDKIMATGYGRSLVEVAFELDTVTEIKAHAAGAWAAFPGAAGILDIGGQDSKAIALFADGRVKKFEMNDRCAAGTGKFLEIMAERLGFAIDDFGDEALRAESAIAISSMCTVFAESEVTSLIARGSDRRQIARGLHDSVVRRAATMIGRIIGEGDIVFSGGVANNHCMVALLAERLGRRFLVAESPQYTGALGAALLARRKL